MSSIATISIFLVILVFSVIAISVVQKREREKEERLRVINQFRYRANNAIGALSNLNQQPIGREARTIMLQYALANTNAIKKLAPDDLKNNNMIKTLTSSLENIDSPADSAKLKIPSDMSALKKQINQFSNLANFILKLKNSTAVSKQLIPTAVSHLMLLISECKICAYIRQGQEALTKNEHISAQQFFATAQQMLDKVTNKNNRLKSLDADLKSIVSGSAQKAAQEALSDEKTSEKDDVQSEKDELFGPKKKW